LSFLIGPALIKSLITPKCLKNMLQKVLQRSLAGTGVHELKLVLIHALITRRAMETSKAHFLSPPNRLHQIPSNDFSLLTRTDSLLPQPDSHPRGWIAHQAVQYRQNMRIKFLSPFSHHLSEAWLSSKYCLLRTRSS